MTGWPTIPIIQNEPVVDQNCVLGQPLRPARKRSRPTTSAYGSTGVGIFTSSSTSFRIGVTGPRIATPGTGTLATGSRGRILTSSLSTARWTSLTGRRRHAYSTRERLHPLLFGDAARTTPVGVISAVSWVPVGPLCDTCHLHGQCHSCKLTHGRDSTYTALQPLATVWLDRATAQSGSGFINLAPSILHYNWL
jgi:hypothetical protein